MATFNLRRFSRPDIIKSIALKHLLAFLRPFDTFLAGRGFQVPAQATPDNFDYDGLCDVLMEPDFDTPQELAEGLFIIDDMATPETMNELLREAEEAGLSINGSPDPTPADVAIQVWLQEPELLERRHARQRIERLKSFEYYQAESMPTRKFRRIPAAALNALQRDLDKWFAKHRRGRGSKVTPYLRGEEVWFTIGHGEPFTRSPAREGDKSTVHFFRPEKYDIVVYDYRIGEIRVHADSKGERELYRSAIGLHLFGDEGFFPDTAKYTLDPIKEDGDACLVCSDVEGIDWIRLVELHYYWGGAYGEIEVRKADDIFAAFAERGRTIGAKDRLIQAKFEVKFSHIKTTRKATLRPPNRAMFKKEGDSGVLDKWLEHRGFSPGAEERYDDEEAEVAVART